MQVIQASEAKAKFLSILDQVEHGESITITRHGKQIALITPVPETTEERAKHAFEKIRELRRRTQPVCIEEILSARDEGRR